MLDQAYHEARRGEGGRVVSAGLERGPRMLEASGLVSLVQAAPYVALLIAPGWYAPLPSPMPYVRWPEDSRGGENTPCTLSDGGATAPSQAADKRRGTLAGLLEPCSPANQACGLFLDAEFNGLGRALISIGLVCADGTGVVRGRRDPSRAAPG
jgi:hypothetical protein